LVVGAYNRSCVGSSQRSCSRLSPSSTVPTQFCALTVALNREKRHLRRAPTKMAGASACSVEAVSTPVRRFPVLHQRVTLVRLMAWRFLAFVPVLRATSTIRPGAPRPRIPSHHESSRDIAKGLAMRLRLCLPTGRKGRLPRQEWGYIHDSSFGSLRVHRCCGVARNRDGLHPAHDPGGPCPGDAFSGRSSFLEGPGRRIRLHAGRRRRRE
jgi:hypothetical protein